MKRGGESNVFVERMTRKRFSYTSRNGENSCRRHRGIVRVQLGIGTMRATMAVVITLENILSSINVYRVNNSRNERKRL